MARINVLYHCDGCGRASSRPTTPFAPLTLPYNLCPRCLKRMKRDLKNPVNLRNLRRVEGLFTGQLTGRRQGNFR